VPAHSIEHGHKNTKAFSYRLSAISYQLQALSGEASEGRLKAGGREQLENLDGTP
jgi:hypothetical protein